MCTRVRLYSIRYFDVSALGLLTPLKSKFERGIRYGFDIAKCSEWVTGGISHLKFRVNEGRIHHCVDRLIIHISNDCPLAGWC